MTQQSPPDAEQAARLAWIEKARRLHAIKRLAGLAGIVVGAAMLMWWKTSAAAPDWALSVGWVILGISWALFVYVIIDRYLWVKRNPYKPPSSM